MSFVHGEKVEHVCALAPYRMKGGLENSEDEKCDVTIMKEGMDVSMKTVERIEPRQRKGVAFDGPSSQ